MREDIQLKVPSPQIDKRRCGPLMCGEIEFFQGKGGGGGFQMLIAIANKCYGTIA